MYQKLLEEAYKSVFQITDPINRIESICKLLPFVDKNTGLVAETGDKGLKKNVKSQPAKNTVTKPDTLEEIESTPVVKESDIAIEAAIEQAKIEVAPEVVETIKKEVTEEVVIPEVKDDETPAEAEHRRAMFIKKFGNLKLSEVFNSQEHMQMIAPEMNSVGEFRTLLHSVLDTLADENTVEELFHHYVSEADENAEEYTDVTMSKFLTDYVKYQANLTKIYSNDLNVIDKAIKELTSGIYGKNDDQIRIGAININNAETLVDVIEAVKQIG